MFESLKHWFSTGSQSGDLFDHKDDEAVHSALASLLYHVIQADHQQSTGEKHKFAEIMRDVFNLSPEQIHHLWLQAESLNSTLDEDLSIINEHLKHNSMQRLQFMDKLNQLICVDGVNVSELEIFHRARNAIFPEISDDL